MSSTARRSCRADGVEREVFFGFAARNNADFNGTIVVFDEALEVCRTLDGVFGLHLPTQRHFVLRSGLLEHLEEA